MTAPADIWRKLGGRGAAPARLGRHGGPLLIMGGGRTLWADVAAAEPWPGERMAINDAGAHFHGIVSHWVTLHPEYLPGWRAYRRGHCYGEGRTPVCHAARVAEGVDVAWPMENLGGTSGLFACYVGLMLGYDRIVLAGVPMDNAGHYFDPPRVATDFEAEGTAEVWQQARDRIFHGRVTSLSGRTREWLGAP